MFPTGMAGVALVILRISGAATLVVDGAGHWSLATPTWALLGIAGPALLLVLGFLTPYCAGICCLVEISAFFLAGSHDQYRLIIDLMNYASLAILGPGAYSIDARIFGRRLLTVPPRN
jgi:hypothetical protein